MASIKFQLLQTENELSNLKRDHQELLTNYINLEKEFTELKIAHQILSKTEKTYKNRVDQIENLENEIKLLKNEITSREAQFKRREREMQNKFDKEILKNRNLNENIQSKIENATAIHRLCDKQQKEIGKLEIELLEKDKKFSQILAQRELKYEINFSDLKKKMVDYIKETHKNISKLNVEQLNTSSKLTMLQNHQLLIELEYNSRQIEELLRKIEKLEKNNFDLRKELEINKDVQLSLVEKNKNISDIFQKILKKEKSSKISKITEKNLEISLNEENLKTSNNNCNLIIPTLENKNFDVNSFNLKKIQNLEKLSRKKEIEYNRIKTDYDIILQKLNRYENDSKVIFDLIETGFKKLSEDEELKNSKEIFVNVKNLKIAEFDKLTNQEKYSILMILLKYLLPLFNFEEMDGLEFTKKVVSNVKMRYRNSSKDKNNVIDQNLQRYQKINKPLTGNFRSSSKMKMNKLICLKNAVKDLEREKEKKLKTAIGFFSKNNVKDKENQNNLDYLESIKVKDKYNTNYNINLLSI